MRHDLEPGGTAGRTITGALDAQHRQVFVVGEPPRSVTKRIYGPNGLYVGLQDVSGTRCFSLAALQDEVCRRVAPTGLALSLRTRRLERGVELTGPRGARLAAGCVVVDDMTPTKDGAASS